MSRSFNGSSDVIHADAARVIGGFTIPFTVSAWINATPVAFASWYSEATTGSAGNLFLCLLDGTTGQRFEFEGRTATSGAVDVFDGTAIIADNTWHHICLKQDGGNNNKFYVDGVLDLSFARTSRSNSSSQHGNNVTIGARQSASTTNFFNGKIAHIATWKREISENEVVSLAKGAPPTLFGPAHYWPLWGDDSPEPGLISSDTDGTLTGTTKGSTLPPVNGLSLLSIA